MRLVREMRLYMTRKLFRYRSFNTETINVYSNVHQKLIGIEKWKLEAFEGVVYPSSPLYFNDPYDCDFCMQRDALEGILDRETLIQALGKKFKLKKNEKNRILKTKNIENTIQQFILFQKSWYRQAAKISELNEAIEGKNKGIDAMKKGIDTMKEEINAYKTEIKKYKEEIEFLTEQNTLLSDKLRMCCETYPSKSVNTNIKSNTGMTKDLLSKDDDEIEL